MRAVVIGVATVAVMVAVAFLITTSVPAVDVANQQAVSHAVDLLAPALNGGDCPDMAQPASAEAGAAARDLVRRATLTPARTVPDPSGTGIDVPLAEVPGVLADEVESCLIVADAPGRGWQAILTALRRVP